MADRIVFMGSPDFAVPTLEKLAAAYPVAGVVTQPDRPAGRGRELAPPPVKEHAIRLGIPIYQPEDLKTDEGYQQLAAWEPDAIVVAAFGQILTQDVLDLPRLGCYNIHASVLPRWRGASPIQAAILAGDAETGVTIMKMDAGLDTGDILAVRREPVLLADTAGTLGERLSLCGADLLLEVLPDILAGDLKGQPQDDSQATFCERIEKEEGVLDFSQPAEVLERRVRAFNPWPSTWFHWNGLQIKVHAAHVIPGQEALPGKRAVFSNLPAVGSAAGWLALDVVQPAGKKKQSGAEFLNGARRWDEPHGFVD